MINIKVPAVVVLLTMVGTFLHAQDSLNTRSDYPTHLLIAGPAMHAYKGDLNDRYDKWGTGIHFSLQFNKNRRFNSELNIAIGQVSGQESQYDYQLSDGSYAPVNTVFSTNFSAISYHLHLNLIKKDHLRLYVSQGLGLMRFQPKDKNGDYLADRNSTRAPDEEYGSITAVLPWQIGGYYLFKNGFGVDAKVSWLNTTTDYIDNISAWGTNNGNDNIFTMRIGLIIPIGYKKLS